VITESLVPTGVERHSAPFHNFIYKHWERFMYENTHNMYITAPLSPFPIATKNQVTTIFNFLFSNTLRFVWRTCTPSINPAPTHALRCGKCHTRSENNNWHYIAAPAHRINSPARVYMAISLQAKMFKRIRAALKGDNVAAAVFCGVLNTSL
jgi:hypothetical protein